MQDRYAGDVGDYVKLGLLRALAPGKSLGVAWYRYPDEDHNGDGRHITYLDSPGGEIARLDPELFDHLRSVTRSERSIRSLLPVLPEVVSSDTALDVTAIPLRQRRDWRVDWFDQVLADLEDCDLVFADPDNGIVDDADRRKGRKVFGKQMPLAEVQALAQGRTAVVYHHNTRRKGGHDAEVDHWMAEIGAPTLAVRAKAYSCRTFFIINPDDEIAGRARTFCARWKPLRVSLHGG